MPKRLPAALPGPLSARPAALAEPALARRLPPGALPSHPSQTHAALESALAGGLSARSLLSAGSLLSARPLLPPRAAPPQSLPAALSARLQALPRSLLPTGLRYGLERLRGLRFMRGWQRQPDRTHPASADVPGQWRMGQVPPPRMTRASAAALAVLLKPEPKAAAGATLPPESARSSCA